MALTQKQLERFRHVLEAMDRRLSGEIQSLYRWLMALPEAVVVTGGTSWPPVKATITSAELAIQALPAKMPAIAVAMATARRDF